MRSRLWAWLGMISIIVAAAPVPAFSAAPDRWIEAGWQVLAQQGLDAAVARWQQGVDQLDPKRVLLSPVGVFTSPAAALHGVRRLGVELRGIVLRARYRGAARYFVLSAPPPAELERYRTHFEQLLYDGKHHIYGWSAARFQRGGSLALLPAAPPRGKVAPSGDGVRHAVVRSQPLPPRPTPEQIAQKLLEMAKAAQAQGNRKQAIALLTELLKRTPEHARARLMAGRLMVENGQYDAAWQVMRPLLKAESLDWKPWFWSGTAELMVGKLNEAARQFDEALARDGRVPEVWVHRALVAQQRGRYKVAYQLLREAEKLAPRSVQVLLNIGLTLDALGRRDAAIDYYRRYLVQTAGVSSQWQARKVVIKRIAEMER